MAPVKPVAKKVDLAIKKIKIVKSSKKKQVIVYKVTIKNIGNKKSKKTNLVFWHIRNHKLKIKNKVYKVKALKPGQKVTLVVKYYPDRDKHKYCHKHYFVVNLKKTMKEKTYKNNKKVLKR
ncbi:MAG: hypothetical protein LBR24_01430 [Methanobrevibacter sp.]|nr:hypothetical protein [Methanobrevibacter sp.]